MNQETDKNIRHALSIGCFILYYVHRCFKGPGVSWYYCDDCLSCILSYDLFTHLLSQIKHSFVYSGRHDCEDAWLEPTAQSTKDYLSNVSSKLNTFLWGGYII